MGAEDFIDQFPQLLEILGIPLLLLRVIKVNGEENLFDGVPRKRRRLPFCTDLIRSFQLGFRRIDDELQLGVPVVVCEGALYRVTEATHECEEGKERPPYFRIRHHETCE